MARSYKMSDFREDCKDPRIEYEVKQIVAYPEVMMGHPTTNGLPSVQPINRNQYNAGRSIVHLIEEVLKKGKA